jgi:hypothetical protein
MLEGLLVGAIVAFAAVYAAWALLPATLRLGSAQRLGAWARRARLPGWLVRITSGLERAARSRIGGCSDCNAAHPPGAPPEDHTKR